MKVQRAAALLAIVTAIALVSSVALHVKWAELHSKRVLHRATLMAVRPAMLLAAGQRADEEDAVHHRGALHRAAFNGQPDVVRFLLASPGEDKEATDLDGDTALHLAAFGGHGRTVSVLLTAGVSKEARDKSGSTPLHRAASEGKGVVVDVLLKAGADKQALNAAGRTPLHVAAGEGRNQTGHQEVIKLLLAAGADIEYKDNTTGFTPLGYAVFEGHEIAVQALLDAVHPHPTRYMYVYIYIYIYIYI